jgi:hypothetical protein
MQGTPLGLCDNLASIQVGGLLAKWAGVSEATRYSQGSKGACLLLAV